MQKISSIPFFRRAVVCVFGGIFFGFVCLGLASQGDPTILDFKNPVFWSILFNRFLIGWVLIFAGAFSTHPVLKIRVFPSIRGAIVGVVVSMNMAIGAFLSQKIPTDEQSSVFWMTILAGAIFGLIIDVVASRVGGTGRDIL